MDSLFNMTLSFILLIILAVGIKTDFTYTNKNNSGQCTKEVYYFQNEYLEYVSADSQQFRILFTGQVANAYFYKNGKEYSTTIYYKETKQGILQGSRCVILN